MTSVLLSILFRFRLSCFTRFLYNTHSLSTLTISSSSIWFAIDIISRKV